MAVERARDYGVVLFRWVALLLCCSPPEVRGAGGEPEQVVSARLVPAVAWSSLCFRTKRWVLFAVSRWRENQPAPGSGEPSVSSVRNLVVDLSWLCVAPLASWLLNLVWLALLVKFVQRLSLWGWKWLSGRDALSSSGQLAHSLDRFSTAHPCDRLGLWWSLLSRCA